MKTKKRYIIVLIMLILSVVIMVSSTPFRLSPTHEIVKEVDCISCHSDELKDLDMGIHLRPMSVAQYKTLYDYIDLYGNISPTYKAIVGPCYSCHVTYGNFKKFGLTDPYLYQSGNYAYTIGNIAVSDTNIDAQYGTIVEWPQSNSGIVEYYGIGNMALASDGTQLYAAYCESCHGSLASSSKLGSTSSQITAAIASVSDMASCCSVLSDAQIQSIADALSMSTQTTPAAINMELSVLSVMPSNSAVNADIKIILSNYSGQQSGSIVCDCAKSLSLGDTQVTNVSNIQNDYFSIVLLLDGTWSSATLGLNVSGTDKGTQSFIINAVPSTVYNIPKDFTGINYLKTIGSYRAVRLDAVWDMWKKYSVNGKITSSDTIRTNSTSGWIAANTCSAPDAMCHINQQTTYMGLTDGMGKIGSLYNHEMESVTSKSCKICHLRYLNVDAIPIQTLPLPVGVIPTPGPTSTAPPTPVGSQLYASYCASCHGPLATSEKLGRTSSQITSAIASVSVMTSCCSILNAAQIQSIADALSLTPTSTPVPTPIPTSSPGPSPTPGPTPMPNAAFKFIAWGDTKGGTNILESESKSMISKNLNPSFTLYAGDLCGSGPDVACFTTWKKALNGDSTGATSNGIFGKTFAIRGNHDASGGSVWQSEFNFNSVASSIGATNYAEQTLDMTYSFDYDNSHFVGIDNPCGNLNSCASDITSSQIVWLDQDLTNAENRGLKHAFLFWHGPAYTVDGHCCGGVSSSMVAVLNKHPIISAGFFGHEHVVEYTHLDSSIIPSLSCSFEQVISGGAGAGLYGLTSGRKVDYYLGQIYGYTMVGVSGNDFDISFYKADGTLMKTLPFTETGTCQ